MIVVREQIRRMEGYVPGEQPQEEGYIKLNTNENPYSPSPRVVERLQAFLSHSSLSLYPHPFSDRVRVQVERVYGVPKDWILVGNGSDEVLNLVFRTLLGKGDRVVYPFPTYTLYRTLALLQEAEPWEIPFPEDFSLPLEFISARASLKVLCNPNSPTGTYIFPDMIEELLQASSCPVLLDEAYIDFAPQSALTLLPRFPNLLIARTLSKSFSLAGLRVGFLFAHPEMVREICKAKDSYNVNILSQVGAEAALETVEHAMKNIERIKKTRLWFSRKMEELGFYVYPSQANFVLVRRKGKDLRPLYEELKRRKILIRYFPEWPDSLRITIGTDEQMEILLAHIQEIMEG
ncbi:MAG: histidinol-phosphate transaminase [Candidatus Caldatribacteriaceae bacterium]